MKQALVLLLLCCSFAAQAQLVTKANKATLVLLREEEKLSRDVYCALNDVWHHETFGHLVQAEENHIEAFVSLMDQYDVKYPAEKTDGQPGKFINEKLQKLYDSLVVAGSASLEQALRSGAYVEEMCILNLQQATRTTSVTDLQVTYKYLVSSGGQHLLAFARSLKREGITYTPVLMLKMDYDRMVGASGGGTGR